MTRALLRLNIADKQEWKYKACSFLAQFILRTTSPHERFWFSPRPMWFHGVEGDIFCDGFSEPKVGHAWGGRFQSYGYIHVDSFEYNETASSIAPYADGTDELRTIFVHTHSCDALVESWRDRLVYLIQNHYKVPLCIRTELSNSSAKAILTVDSALIRVEVQFRDTQRDPRTIAEMLCLAYFIALQEQTESEFGELKQ